MTDEELRQLIASNARAVQVAANERIELRLAISRLEQNNSRLEQALEKIVMLNEKVKQTRHRY